MDMERILELIKKGLNNKVEEVIVAILEDYNTEHDATINKEDLDMDNIKESILDIVTTNLENIDERKDY